MYICINLDLFAHVYSVVCRNSQGDIFDKLLCLIFLLQYLYIILYIQIIYNIIYSIYKIEIQRGLHNLHLIYKSVKVCK